MKEAQILNRATVVIIQLRYQQGYTQRYVANELNLHLSAYSRLEAGKQKVTLVNLVRLGGLYGMSLTDIVALIEADGNTLKKAV